MYELLFFRMPATRLSLLYSKHRKDSSIPLGLLGASGEEPVVFMVAVDLLCRCRCRR